MGVKLTQISNYGDTELNKVALVFLNTGKYMPSCILGRIIFCQVGQCLDLMDGCFRRV